MEIYIKLFEVIFPVFFIIGYFIGKKDKKFDTKFITNFAANVVHAMIIYALNSKNITFQTLLTIFGIASSNNWFCYYRNYFLIFCQIKRYYKRTPSIYDA